MSTTKGSSKAHRVVENVVEEELCRQAFGLFDKSGSGTISKTVRTHFYLSLLDVMYRDLCRQIFLVF